MKELKYLLVLFFLFVSAQSFSQSIKQLQKLMEIKNEQESLFLQKKGEAVKRAKVLGIPIKQSLPNGSIMELMYFEGDQPFYYVTNNINAARTISTDDIQPNGGAGYSLTGIGETLAIWDEARVRMAHQEFGNRVTIGDNATSYSNHSTHVAGTMIASGFQSNARGMAYQANLVSRDWNSDQAEMANAAANGLFVSNHSYGFLRGWVWNGLSWVWYGNSSISNTEDYLYGFYDATARGWDLIANNAPYYLIVKSAGNDRGEGPTGYTHEIDGGSDGFDCISQNGVAKNILTVGAVQDIPGGYTSSADVVIASFSGYGPADDGRIKPDIVANGISLYSPVAFDVNNNISNSSYNTYSGTSMATPGISGSIGLLCQHQRNIYNDVVYRASTMKGLLLHTADEAGANAGPDYRFGWGLANLRRAAQLMEADGNDCVNIREYILDEGETLSIPVVKSTSQDLKVTICWNDPAGTPPTASLNPLNAMLVNDLDLRVEGGGNTYLPWVLNRNNPSNAATRGDNTVDNVEQVIVNSTYRGLYTISISHKGNLKNGSQIVSLIISGNNGISGNNTITNYSTTGAMAFWAHDLITSSTTTLNNGSDVVFVCGNTISLQNGFKAVSGASFSAKIDESLTCTSGSFILKTATISPRKFVYERNIISQTNEINSIEEDIVLEKEVSVFPNPSTGIFDIQVKGENILRVDVIDLTGKIIVVENNLNKNSTQINLSEHKKGIYLLRLLTENGTIAKKIILK